LTMTRAAQLDVPVLKSYVAGQWLSGTGMGHCLVNPTSGDTVAWCSTEGVDFGKALAFARNAGGMTLSGSGSRGRLRCCWQSPPTLCT